MAWNYKFTRQDLRIGTQHEMEHTKVKNKAKNIALDHLREHPSYYRVLKKAEMIMFSVDKRMNKSRRKRR